MDHNSRGDSAELSTATIIRKYGGQVSFPFGDNAEYDLIADIDGELYRIQVKTAHKRNGEPNSVRAELSHGSNSGRKYGYDDVEVYVLYYPELDEHYWIWDEESSETVARVALQESSEIHPPNKERATLRENVLLENRLDDITESFK